MKDRGGLNQPCYEGGSCDTDLSCQDEMCVPVSFCEPRHTVFLNFGGGFFYERLRRLKREQEPRCLNESGAQLIPFAGGNEAIENIVDAFRTRVAPYDVLVTVVDPGNLPHTEVVITSDGGEAIGHPNSLSFGSTNCGDNEFPYRFYIGWNIER